MAVNDPTPEEITEKILLVRILIGDLPASIFYPLLSDAEIEALLRLENWDVKRAARRAAISAAFYLSGWSTRERAGEIEVWNSAAVEYKKVLNQFLDESNALSLPDDIVAYAAGISKSDVCAHNNNPDTNRSPLARITPCLAWWTKVKHYEKCCSNDILTILNGI